MKKYNEEVVLVNDSFIELSEECQLLVDGGKCSGSGHSGSGNNNGNNSGNNNGVGNGNGNNDLVVGLICWMF